MLDIQIFPNPAEGVFNVSARGFSNQLRINVKTHTGQTILSKTINNTDFSIDIQGQTKGVYFITIDDGNKQVVKKIVLI